MIRLGSQTSIHRSFQVVALFSFVAFCACGKVAIAKTQLVASAKVQTQSQAVPLTKSGPLPPGLYPVSQAFVHTPYNATLPNNGWVNNVDGSELWPCTTPSADCPTIGDPPIPFSGGFVIGTPRFTFSLSACNGTTNGTQVPYTWDQGETWNAFAINDYYVPCGQINALYEDWTSDSTDDVLTSYVVRQGLKVIADSGVQDWGPNTYYAGTGDLYTIIVYQDFNFGALGQTGPNNGNCVPNYKYPTTAIPTSYPFIIAENLTCADPAAGLATITVRNELAAPTWTCKTTSEVTSCKVKYAIKYALEQTWNIYLQ
jgi:hypothetical protein